MKLILKNSKLVFQKSFDNLEPDLTYQGNAFASENLELHKFWLDDTSYQAQLPTDAFVYDVTAYRGQTLKIKTGVYQNNDGTSRNVGGVFYNAALTKNNTTSEWQNAYIETIGSSTSQSDNTAFYDLEVQVPSTAVTLCVNCKRENASIYKVAVVVS